MQADSTRRAMNYPVTPSREFRFTSKDGLRISCTWWDSLGNGHRDFEGLVRGLLIVCGFSGSTANRLTIPI